MTATPPSFADTPQTVPRGADLLTDMLRAVRLNGSVFMNARLTAPFGILTARHFDARKPLSRLRHVSIFHLIANGACTVELPGEPPRDVSAGDVLLVPFSQEHRIRTGDYRGEIVNAETLIEPGPLAGMWRIDHGGGGDTTRIVCGFIESSEFLFSPVFRTLPSLIVYQAGTDRIGSVITSTVHQILELADTSTPGAELMLGHLMEMLFLEALRRYAIDLPPDARGWFAAINDPLVSRVLRIVHEEPSHRWTVEELVKSVGSSRTVLADRFKALLGQAPMEYVCAWRMQIAAGRLRAGTDSLAAIAADVGYESEAAFNRAFKRVTGVTPGRWREGAAEGRWQPGH